jgi:hypothetical protein
MFVYNATKEPDPTEDGRQAHKSESHVRIPAELPWNVLGIESSHFAKDPAASLESKHARIFVEHTPVLVARLLSTVAERKKCWQAKHPPTLGPFITPLPLC